MHEPFLTRADLGTDLERLGLRPGDVRGRVGAAGCVLVSSPAICTFAVGWMEQHHPELTSRSRR